MGTDGTRRLYKPVATFKAGIPWGPRECRGGLHISENSCVVRAKPEDQCCCREQQCLKQPSFLFESWLSDENDSRLSYFLVFEEFYFPHS